jgi:hypothetical protein
MSEPEFEEFLDDVSARMGVGAARRAELRDELRAHLDEQWDELAVGDGDRQTRVEQVLADFGPPERLARALARPYQRRLLRMVSLAAASLLLTLIVHTQFNGGRHEAQPTNLAQALAEPPARAGLAWPLLPMAGSGVAMVDDADALNRALRTRIAEVKLADGTLEEAFAYIRKLTDINIWVNWNALASAGIDPMTSVSIHLRDVTLGRFLELLCAYLGTDGPGLAFGYKDNVIEVSTADLLRSRRLDTDTEKRVYDVRDMLKSAVRSDENDEEAAARLEMLQDELRSLITGSVASDIWQDAGGDDGSIEYFAGLMVVRAPATVQAEVGQLLDQLAGHLLGQSLGMTRAADQELPLAGPTPVPTERKGRFIDPNRSAPARSKNKAPDGKAGTRPKKKKPQARKVETTNPEAVDPIETAPPETTDPVMEPAEEAAPPQEAEPMAEGH